MGQHEGGFVLNVQIAPELKGRDPLNGVHEDSDGG
jgi:hypothetical protein